MKNEDAPSIGAMFKFVFGTVLKRRWLLVLNVLALTIITMLQFVLPQVEKYIIDKVIPEKNFSLLVWTIIILLVTAALLAIFNFLSTYYMTVMSQNSITELRNQLFGQIIRQDTAFFESSKTGDLMTRLTSDINNLQSLISANMLSVVGNMFTFVGVLGLIYYINWQMALAVSVTFPLMFLVYRIFRTRIRDAFQRARTTQGLMSNQMQQTLTQIDLIKSYTSENQESTRFGKVADANRKNMISAGFNQAVFNPSIDTINYVGIAIILFMGAIFIMRGDLTVGALVAYISYVAMVQAPIQSLSRLLNQVQQANVSFGRIQQITKAEPVVIDAKDAVEFPGLHQTVNLQDVTFSYHDSQILHGVTFDIPAGKTTALVGRSGSGKTTITRMLTRLYDIDSGEIDYDGISISNIALHSLRANVAIVSQEVYMIDGTIRDNVRYGRLNASDDDIWEVLKLADLDSFVHSIPDGLDTEVGERGMRLSGGQKQRVAIARALLKDAPLIILDEATASLDNESEKAIQHALDNLLTNRTSLVIAHRLSTVQNADQIVVLQDGKVVERGTHQSLLDAKGAYAQLYNAQFE
ncbi:ABC transporter ATP-binding protein [Paucilactobacillus nenjiangensis]|uniref:ABC transporter ATP-binding protein n=1 Tax=Paucilactobacillus nenjiangensis TaxID=1296540 RepID=A0A5P1X280_9LACO|nr:ABC transporter ATP-binding protein [Paucilactobacillus nenjiangensis]QER67515.1 ABC transporter ATP-binding protein [Paucilactobacillus nenjiangensis]